MYEEIVKVMESTNINFLIGSGLSVGAFNTLEMEYKDDPARFGNKYYDKKKIIDKSMTEQGLYENLKNNNFSYETYIDLLEEIYREKEIEKFKDQFKKQTYEYEGVLNNYSEFFEQINQFIVNKDEKKVVNIFTSNYDMLINEALIENELTFNDGFYKDKKFNLEKMDEISAVKDINGNIKESSHYNLIKFHGSLDWKGIGNEEIEKKREYNIDDFVGIMPSHLKYKELLFSYTYYELINKLKEALAIENTTLFILGFSMRDQHIKKIINTALKKNKTLKIYFVSYCNEVEDFIYDFAKDKKFNIIKPVDFKEKAIGMLITIDNFNFKRLIKLFKGDLKAND